MTGGQRVVTHLREGNGRIAAIWAAVLLCVGIGGCEQKTAATSALPPASTPEQAAKAKYELDEKCAADTRAWFKANYSEVPEPLRVQGGGTITTTQPTYQNHYSHKLNGCFALLESMTSFSSPQAQLLQTDSIWNVNENRKIGVLVQKDLRTVTACNADGRQCTSKAEWEGLAREYLVE